MFQRKQHEGSLAQSYTEQGVCSLRFGCWWDRKWERGCGARQGGRKPILEVPLRVVEPAFLSHVCKLQLPSVHPIRGDEAMLTRAYVLPSSSLVSLLPRGSQAFLTSPLRISAISVLILLRKSLTPARFAALLFTQFVPFSSQLPFSKPSHPLRSHSDSYLL